MVLSHDHGHCESSPGSFDECILSAGWLPTLRLSQPIWVVTVSPPINDCLVLLLSMLADGPITWRNSAMVWKLLRNVLQLPVNIFCSFEICCCYVCYRRVLFVYILKITNGIKLKR